MSRHDKKDEDGIVSVFQKLDKGTLLQEARYFNTSPVDPKKCVKILTKLLYFLNQGESLTIPEATELFFGVTKLFGSNDVKLRRMVYLCIKELSSLAQDVIIMTSSLIKDMTGKQHFYKAAALRTLSSITDSSMLNSMGRYMRQAIMDRDPAVSSAALVTALHMEPTHPALVRGWSAEVHEAMVAQNPMVGYHALALMVSMHHDNHANVLLRCTTGRKLYSPYTLCFLISNIAKLAEENLGIFELYMEFIEWCLRHKSEMVAYEAAHAIVHLRSSEAELAPAVSVLQSFCRSPQTTTRFAGVRTLAKLTAKHPDAVTASVTTDLQNLISDPNRFVATLAVTALLDTGAESSIECLMQQISSFMSEVSDDFKIIVLAAINRLCAKYPRKHLSLATFLAEMLRDTGGLQYKSNITEVMIGLVQSNPDIAETGQAHLCNFIEDCEHPRLAVRILHFIGREGPKSRDPSKSIRFIYNRLLLESDQVRAAAVSTLARFGVVPELLPHVLVLLQRCTLDEGDEVRDRAVFYLNILSSGDPQLINDYITNVRMVDPILLDRALRDHLATNSEEPFDINSVPTQEESNQAKEAAKKTINHKLSPVSREEQYADQLKIIPNIEKLGPIFKCCEPVELTEPETEYRARCVKHIFARHLVLQFQCINTLNDQLLEQVQVRFEPSPGYILNSQVLCQKLSYNKPGSVFTVFEFPENPIESLGNIEATLEFVVRDCDAITGLPVAGNGYADTYPLEEIAIGFADQFRTRTATDEWEASWESAASGAETSGTFVLPQSDVEEAANAVCEHLGLPKAAISGDAVKEIHGDAQWRGATPVLMRARLVAAHGVVNMQLSARSPKEEIAALVLASVA